MRITTTEQLLQRYAAGARRLGGATLDGGALPRAGLPEIDLRESLLRDVDLHDADLRGAVGIVVLTHCGEPAGVQCREEEVVDPRGGQQLAADGQVTRAAPAGQQHLPRVLLLRGRDADRRCLQLPSGAPIAASTAPSRRSR